jgi:N-acetylglucosamine-6-phosphate deacetylase
MSRTAITGATIVTPEDEIEGHTLVIGGGRILDIVPDGGATQADKMQLDGGWILPGFIDLQVNGGGDVLLNDHPTPEAMGRIAAAHRRFGTTGLLPTLISDTPEKVALAIDAADRAIASAMPGILGVHIEGPHLNPAKKGIHDAGMFRRLDRSTVELLARPGAGARLVTIAPEVAEDGMIAALRSVGIRVAAGHSVADYELASRAIEQGLSGFTHLFNAMTQLGSREPGMVGAALESQATKFGIIADGHHVHPASFKVALAAKGADGVMLVTDAMPPVGGTKDSFSLGGVEVRVVDGTCRGPDGTLGGSMLTMAQAFRNTLEWAGLPVRVVSRMASGNAAEFMGLGEQTGSIRIGLAADLVHLGEDLHVRRTWIHGDAQESGE